jgi:hypothetical protein
MLLHCSPNEAGIVMCIPAPAKPICAIFVEKRDVHGQWQNLS